MSLQVVPPPAPGGAPAAPFCERLAEELRQRTRALERAARRCRSLGDDEAIHDLRVAARRLTAALSLWRGALRRRPRRAAMRSLRRLRRRTGGTREAEVSAALLAVRIAAAGEGPAPEAEALLRRQRRRVERGRERAALAARGRRLRRLARRVERALAAPPGAEPATLEAARRRLERPAAAARAALAAALESKADDALHRARVAVKKWRYALESLDAVAAGPDRPARPALRELQQALGAVHDLAVLRDLVAARMAKAEARGLESGAQRLAALAAALAAERSTALGRVEGGAAAL